ncbi:hypothetical protein DL546_007281 [Coniochaeta pulveracea]|uniref:Uncharacterized protein n=1 Tax=Coniochaeta pulveracea TaxID=177199 RepID=A0A420YC35_9PEZI|nr:hypothetical protein DL546_007281 [Coniochaeta pulveracea]
MSEGAGQGSGNSSAGSAGVLQAGDQRNYSEHEAQNQHFTGDDKKDEVAALKKDPTAPARMHGNNPSRGAEIDAELQAEDEAILKKKGDAMAGKKN